MLLAAPLLVAATKPPVVEVKGGRVRGSIGQDRLFFRGIPYAAPPLDARRWRPPAPVAPWRGIADATRPAPACLQNDYGWNRANHGFASEDCLTLEVATPALSGKRPVFVWVHGGSNRAGSGAGMGRTPMVARGIVVVSMQYRLGIFGFLAHRGALDRGHAGNYGLMDQIAALRWVRDNIARFGGDPGRVTIAGESAGAQDVGLLIASPAARGLFSQAVMQSGTPNFGLPARTLDDALRLGDQVDAALGTGGSIATLRRAPARALLAADLQLHDARLMADDYLWLRPTVDGVVLPDDPAILMKDAPPRPAIIGSNRFELDLPGGSVARDAFIKLSFGANADAARAFYRIGRADPAADPRLGTLDQQIATDATFRCPAGRMAAAMAARGAPVWRYEFDLAPDGGRTAHSVEIAYFWGERRMGRRHLVDYWANFAATGDPNGAGLPTWPRFDAGRRRYVAFADGAVAVRSSLRQTICRLTEAL